MAFETFWEKFESADFVAVPVNTVNVMGAGLALAINGFMTKQDKAEYAEFCKYAEPGDSIQGTGRYIYCFTKDHWKYPSQVTWIELCLQNLILCASKERTLLLPRLGAGLGGIKVETIDKLYAHYVPLMGWKEVYLT